MPVKYPVCECNTCGGPIQGPMVLIPTGVVEGKYQAEPFHARCAAQSFASESTSQVMGAGRWLAEIAQTVADADSPRKRKKRK